MRYQNELTRLLNIKHPLIMAPMFLVSNVAMIKAAMEANILGCFPSLNFRDERTLDEVLKELNIFLDARKQMEGNYGMNIIVQKSNPWYEKHLDVCISN